MRNGVFCKVINKLNGVAYNDIVWLGFVWLALATLWTELFAVGECTIGDFDALDEDLCPNGLSLTKSSEFSGSSTIAR
jgi:hypothetical protein